MKPSNKKFIINTILFLERKTTSGSLTSTFNKTLNSYFEKNNMFNKTINSNIILNVLAVFDTQKQLKTTLDLNPIESSYISQSRDILSTFNTEFSQNLSSYNDKLKEQNLSEKKILKDYNDLIQSKLTAILKHKALKSHNEIIDVKTVVNNAINNIEENHNNIILHLNKLETVYLTSKTNTKVFDRDPEEVVLYINTEREQLVAFIDSKKSINKTTGDKKTESNNTLSDELSKNKEGQTKAQDIENPENNVNPSIFNS